MKKARALERDADEISVSWQEPNGEWHGTRYFISKYAQPDELEGLYELMVRAASSDAKKRGTEIAEAA